MGRSVRLLLVEDDSSIVMFLKDFLEKEGFEVNHADEQSEALYLLEGKPVDLILLDVSLKRGSGFSVCKAIKEKYHNIPVIFLTAADDEYSVVTGLDLGADDYICKPFRPRELVSRLHSVLRRYKTAEERECLRFGNVEIFPEKGLVRKNGTEVVLSAMEYRLLLVLVQNRGVTLSRTRLLQGVWDITGEFVNDNTLTVYMKRLRDKLEDDPKEPTLIKTIRGMGYRMDE